MKMFRSPFSQCVLLCVLLFPVIPIPGASQGIPWDSNSAEKGIDGIFSIASSIISDSLTPMTHYRENQYNVSLVPAWFKVSQLRSDPGIQGEGMTGKALALGAGYAATGRIMAYGILSALDIGGDSRLENQARTTIDSSFRLYTINAGIGYDLLGGGMKISLPLYLGLSLQRYAARMEFSPVQQDTQTQYAELKGKGTIYGFNIAAACSADLFDRIRITPYYIFMRSMNSPEVEATVTADTAVPVPVTHTEKIGIKAKNLNRGMVGFNFGLLSAGSWSFSVNTGGLIMSYARRYSERYMEGMKIFSVVAALTYRGNVSE